MQASEWAAPGAVVGILGIILGIWRWILLEIRAIKISLVEIEDALRGYKGQGGLLADMAHLRHEAATVDERIAKSRHDLRNALGADLGKAEADMLDMIRDVERRVQPPRGR